jgi:hypothetical protein
MWAQGHQLPLGARRRVVRFAQISGPYFNRWRRPSRARSRPEQVQQCAQTNLRYSVTSSALASSVGGTVRPSIRAICALMTSANLLDCTTGRSAGFSPLRMRPV